MSSPAASSDRPVPAFPVPAFASRHIGPRDHDLDVMLEAVGHSSLDELTAAAVPPGIADEPHLSIEPAASEHAVIDELRAFARDNRVTTR